MNQAVSVNTPRPHLWRYDRSNALFKIPARKVRDSKTNVLTFLNQIVNLRRQWTEDERKELKRAEVYEIGLFDGKKLLENHAKIEELRKIYYV